MLEIIAGHYSQMTLNMCTVHGTAEVEAQSLGKRKLAKLPSILDLGRLSELTQLV